MKLKVKEMCIINNNLFTKVTVSLPVYWYGTGAVRVGSDFINKMVTGTFRYRYCVLQNNKKVSYLSQNCLFGIFG
jgi:hypothetical protein